MKSLKSLLFLFVIGTLIISCDQEEVNPVGPVGDQQFFEASAVMWKTSGSPVKQSDAGLTLELQLAGEGHSNALSDITLQNSHTEVFGDDQQSFEIEDGKFLIKSISGEELFGTYSGTGALRHGVVEIFETYVIQGGTGKFTNAMGTLSVERNQVVQSNQHIYRSGTIATSISGTIQFAKDLN